MRNFAADLSGGVLGGGLAVEVLLCCEIFKKRPKTLKNPLTPIGSCREAHMAKPPPRTPPERSAAKFRILWRAERLPIIFLSPNGEQKSCPKLVPNDNILNCPAREDLFEGPP